MSSEGRRVVLAMAIAEVVPDRYPELRQEVRLYVQPLLAAFEREVREAPLPPVAHGSKCAGPSWRGSVSAYACSCGIRWVALPPDSTEDAARVAGPHAAQEFDEADMSADEGRP